MRYLERKINRYLEAWKMNEERKPLIVKGPRQVGKTESIRKFAESHYESIIEPINEQILKFAQSYPANSRTAPSNAPLLMKS